MKRVLTLSFLTVLIVAIAACAPNSRVFDQPKSVVASPKPTDKPAPTAAPTVTKMPVPPMPTATDVPPTATRVPPTSAPTAKPATNWQLPDPPGPGSLPKNLLPQIAYQQPPVDCAEPNDPNQTCSTIEGQKTDGDFTLKSGYALVMTGDLIVIDYPGPFLFRPDASTNHDLWVLVNNSGKDMRAHMTALYGSFRGYFSLNGARWTPTLVAHLRDLHIEHFLIGDQPKKFTPTPVANCDSKNGCDDTSVRVIVFDGTNWNVGSYGVYRELPLMWWVASTP